MGKPVVPEKVPKVVIKVTSKEDVFASGTDEELHMGEKLPLSRADTRTVTNHVPILFLFPANNSPATRVSPPQIMPADVGSLLKSSLTEALREYYPLAGRLGLYIGPEGKQYCVICNNAGVPYVTATANQTMATAIPELKLAKTYPLGLSSSPPPNITPVLEYPLLTVQATTFTCGGLVLAVSFHHMLSDGRGFFQGFMKVWSSIAQKQPYTSPVHDRLRIIERYIPGARGNSNGQKQDKYYIAAHANGVVEPLLESRVGKDVEVKRAQRDYTSVLQDNITSRLGAVLQYVKGAIYLADLVFQCQWHPDGSSTCIHFTEEEVRLLKAKASLPAAPVPNSTNRASKKPSPWDLVAYLRSYGRGQGVPDACLSTTDTSDVGYVSTDDAMSAHMWQRIQKARNLRPDAITTFLRAVDARSRLQPPLPREYFGNAVFGDHQGPVKVTAGELLSTPLQNVARYLRHTILALNEEYYTSYAKLPEPPIPPAGVIPPVVGRGNLFSSWASFDIYSCDFSWGKPAFICISYGTTPRFLSGTTIFQKAHPDEGGMDVTVMLPARDIKRLLADPELHPLSQNGAVH